MERTIAERITTFRLAIKCTESLFTSTIGVPQSTYSKQINNDNVSLQTVLSIVGQFPNISLDWILLGKGPMIKEEKLSQDAELHDVCIEQAKEIFRLKKRIVELESKN